MFCGYEIVNKMNNFKSRRITMKLKTPNPLFKKWLTEWRDKARNENSKMEFCFNLALQSLKRYPLPLERGIDCKILKGFGKKLCLMIDNKLKTHQMNDITNLDNAVTGQLCINEVSDVQRRKPDQDNFSLKGKNSCSKEYFPEEGSGGYAILVTLYTESLKPTYEGFLTKQQIIKKGQHLSHTSFTKPDPGCRYTAWSSMRRLIAKNLVIKKNNPPKFSLSDEGVTLSKKLFDKKESLNSDKNISYESVKKINEEICIDLIENTTLTSVFSPSSISSQISAKCFSSILPEHEKNSNTDIKTNSSITSIRNAKITNGKDILYCGTSSEVFIQSSMESSESENRVQLDLNKNQSKAIQKHVSNSSVASSTQSVTYEECFILPPNNFDIILYVDTCETSGSKALIQDDPILSELKQLGIFYEVKKLKIGDYIWICRDKISKEELVLPYIIERKRMDDFGHSIKDGRYHEQKFRLKRSGIQNVIYIIERFGSNQHVGLPLTTLYQAATNTAIQDGFCVKFTENIRATARYLANVSTILIKIFKLKTLVSCPKEHISDISLEDDLISIMTFKEFNSTSSKNKLMKVSDLFVKMLLQIKGMSVDRALAIVAKYPTPALLRRAYQEHEGAKGEKLLASIQFGDCNKNIGPILSKIVHQFFTVESFY